MKFFSWKNSLWRIALMFWFNKRSNLADCFHLAFKVSATLWLWTFLYSGCSLIQYWAKIICLLIAMFPVYLHLHTSSRVNIRSGPEQTCMAVGSRDRCQWSGSGHWEWGCLEPALWSRIRCCAKTPWNGSSQVNQKF